MIIHVIGNQFFKFLPLFLLWNFLNATSRSHFYFLAGVMVGMGQKDSYVGAEIDPAFRLTKLAKVETKLRSEATDSADSNSS